MSLICKRVPLKQTKVDEQKRIETRQRLENGKSYKWLQKIADIMDRYYLDAALGFAIPGGIGDAIAAVFSTGYILESQYTDPMADMPTIRNNLDFMGNIMTEIYVTFK